MTQPSLFVPSVAGATPKTARAALIGHSRQDNMDAQFERVFGVSMNAYYVHYLYGMDIIRFDKEVLHSDEQGVSMEEAILCRIAQAQCEGIRFTVTGSALAYYIRFLCTGQRADDEARPQDDKYEQRLKELRAALV